MKEGWETKKLQDVATKIGSGATPLGGDAAYKSSGISLIRSLNVHDAGFRMKDLRSSTTSKPPNWTMSSL